MSSAADSTTASAALAAGGRFAQSVADFTPRAAQQEMAAAVADAIENCGVLVAESGTGTGKTYAYLTPIVLSGRRAIVSTATRHLQEQIFHRDLPRVAAALDKPINAVLLKGRRNYLCTYRLAQHCAQGELLDADARRSLAAIQQWAATTTHGDIAEVADIGEDAPVWAQATSTADNCLGGKCPDFSQCYVFKARKRALKADIVVVNHHLFFSDLAMRAEGAGEILPQAETVVFDEAHNIAETAAAFFGFAVTSGQLAELGRDTLTEAAAAKVGAAKGSSIKLTAVVKKLQRAVTALARACKPFAEQSADWETLQTAKFATAFAKLNAAVEELREKLTRAVTDKNRAGGEGVGEGLLRCLDRCLVAQGDLDRWQHGDDRNIIRWAEIGAAKFRLRGTPLSIRAHMAEMFAEHARAWIFTSATLAMGEDFSAFCRRLGLGEVSMRRWESPYDYQRNALLYLPPAMPDPRQAEYEHALTAVITEVLSASRGRAFCLFTSRAMMQRVYKRLQQQFGAEEWTLLLQGDAPKSKLLAQFNAAKRAVLFGTASFWEGVDVKGEQLSCVIIDKLPFAPPDGPVWKNQLRACEQDGGNAFMEIQMPQAVIALKQGVGRLIRAESDRGVLVLCDPRIRGKGYGKIFLQSLPQMQTTQSIAAVTAFFGA